MNQGAGKEMKKTTIELVYEYPTPISYFISICILYGSISKSGNKYGGIFSATDKKKVDPSIIVLAVPYHNTITVELWVFCVFRPYLCMMHAVFLFSVCTKVYVEYT